MGALACLDCLKYKVLGDGTRESDAHHDHAYHPEEDDVIACLQQRGGVELVEVGRFVGPAHGGEGEEAGGKPGIQHIHILQHPEVLKPAPPWVSCFRILCRVLPVDLVQHY